MIHSTPVIRDINFPGLPLLKEGKVRSLFDFGESLLLVTSDRVSAFDYILPQGIPNKGRILTEVSSFWFDRLSHVVPNHLISTDVADFPAITKPFHEQLAGRSMWVKKTEIFPVECVVRGYIVGSGWKDYQKTGQVCGIDLPEGLEQAGPFDEPLFTPATKAEMGDHDENISFETMIDTVGKERAEDLKRISLQLYKEGAAHAASKGIILADTKFEFGLLNDEIILIDEVMTPDSSRYWSKEMYAPGMSPPSYDKQIVRDYLESTDWDKASAPPNLPDAIIEKASQKYLEIQSLLLS